MVTLSVDAGNSTSPSLEHPTSQNPPTFFFHFKTLDPRALWEKRLAIPHVEAPRVQGTVQVVPLQIAATQFPVVMRADVVDRVRDAIDANDGELAPFRANDDASTFSQFRRSE
ncbi:MAG: hypothetical protein Q8N23_07990 [Archangium sp.]|nr:hypothetical protein [Archangium sp.]MDP3571013.1 hypothetical protein [Archangium sp.]